MRLKLLRAPFPWFGGKSRVAHLVWERFGQVRNYVEPFAGSLAVLLGRPDDPGIETVNDADAYLSNFWRAVAADPDEVARWADWPVSEPDLHARHRWLVETGAERLAQIKADPEYFDAKVAGWWVWGQCLWIGSGWCARPEWTGRVHAGAKARGINSAEVAGKLPAIAGRDGGRGAYAKSRNPRAGDPIDGHERRPHLAGEGYGMGVHAERLAEKRPLLTGNNGGEVGVRRAFGKRPSLGNLGGGQGVHAPGIGSAGWAKRPSLAQGGQRGALAHQIPDLSGDSGAAGRGIHASGFLPRSGGLQAYMRALSDRLRRVRVCCGDFERILGPAVTTCIGTTGVFLDPPYPAEDRAVCYSHDCSGDLGPFFAPVDFNELDEDHLAAEKRRITRELHQAGYGGVWWRAYRWAVEHGADPGLRIALCGYAQPDAVFPAGWVEIPWKASGGYGSRSERGRANARRERIWFSPGCLQVGQGRLF